VNGSAIEPFNPYCPNCGSLVDLKTHKCGLCSRPRVPPPKDTGLHPRYRKNVCQECGEPFQGLYCPNGHRKGSDEDEGEEPGLGVFIVTR